MTCDLWKLNLAFHFFPNNYMYSALLILVYLEKEVFMVVLLFFYGFKAQSSEFRVYRDRIL